MIESFSDRVVPCLFLLAYLCNVVSNSYVMHFGSDDSFYWSKHVSMLLIAVWGAASLAVRILLTGGAQIDSVACWFMLAGLPYLTHGDLGAALYLQLLVVLSASLTVRRIWIKETFHQLRWACVAISLVPLVVDGLAHNGDFIYNTFYGRARLLVGYWHPKEAGIAVLVALLFFKVRTLRTFLLVDVIGIPLLWLVQSRNALLFYFNFLLATALLRYFGPRVFAVAFFLLYVVVPGFVLASADAWLDGVLSGRLSYWLSADDVLSAGRSLDLSSAAAGTSLHIDNSYLEYLSLNGPLALAVLVAILLGISVSLGRKKIGCIYKNALFWPFLIYCFFDSALFSTGNFLNLLLLSMVLAPSSLIETAIPIPSQRDRKVLNAASAPARS